MGLTGRLLCRPGLVNRGLQRAEESRKTGRVSPRGRAQRAKTLPSRKRNASNKEGFPASARLL